MSEACSFCPKARNKKSGKEVPSKLFMGLLEYSSNDRQFAKENYAVAISDEFKDKFGHRVDYDDNDEPTATSYLKLSEKQRDNERIIKSLNKELGAGVYEYIEADIRRQTFENSSSEDVNEDFTVLMTPEEKGKCRIQMAENTSSNRTTTTQTIENQQLFDRIKKAVNALGGDIVFIDERFSKYTTENAQQLANELYAVIQLAHGGNITHDLAHEAGHFAVGALGKNPLISRLSSRLTPKVMKELLGKEYDVVRTLDDPIREAMGILVGRYIENESDVQSIPKRLLSRIVDSAKKMFYRLTGDTVNLMQQEAKEVAKQIANNFMSHKNAGDVHTALETQETLRNTTEDRSTEAFRGMIQQLGLLSKEIGAFDKRLEADFNKNIADVAGDKLNDLTDPDITIISLKGILDGLSLLESHATTLTVDVLDKTPKAFPTLANNLQYAVNLRNTSIYLKYLNGIMDSIDALLESDPNIPDSYKNAIVNLTSSLNTTRKKLRSTVLDRQRALFLKTLVDTYGKEYVERAERMVFNPKNKKGLFGKLERREATKEKSEEFLERQLKYGDYSDDWLESFVSMADSIDIINQLVYKLSQDFNTAAQQNVLKAISDIRELEYRNNQNGVDTELLFDRYKRDILDENGEIIHHKGDLTGNYVSPLDWASWEEDFKAYKKSIDNQFDSTFPDNKKWLPTVRAVRKAAFAKPYIQKWHKEHSYYNKDEERYEPLSNQNPDHPNSGMYSNEAYYNLSYLERDAADSFLVIKKEADKLLTQRNYKQGASWAIYVNPVRMPQFRSGDFIDETRNIIREEKANGSKVGIGKRTKIAGKSILKRLAAGFSHQANDTDYGNIATQYTENDDIDPNDPSTLYNGEIYEDSKDIRRVATYGINKFTNMNDLTHDLYSGLLQYVGMAQLYNTQYNLSNILENGADVLANRKYNSGSTFLENATRLISRKSTNVLGHFQDFLNCTIYGLYSSNRYDSGKLATEKAIGTLNGFMSSVYLAGNVGGAMVNTTTGAIEIMKEAFSGSSYSGKDLWWAEKLFLKNTKKFWSQLGKEDRDDKLSLFLQFYDAGNRLEEKLKRYSTTDTRFGRSLGDMMLLYSSGDYWMQSMSYLATAKQTMLKLKDGSLVNLYDAMTTESTIPGNPNAPRKLKYRDDLATVRDPATNQLMHIMVDKDGNETTWEDVAQAKYQNSCREINNRMHGIYNRMDRTTFHHSILGKLFSTMKGYAFGYLVRKFSSNRFNVILDRESEGELLSVIKPILGLVCGTTENISKKKLAASVFRAFLPIFKNTEKFFTSQGYSVEQYRNMRRSYFGYAAGLLLELIHDATAYMLGRGDDDDDDKLTEDEKAQLKEQYKNLGLEDMEIAALLGTLPSYYRAQYKKELEEDGYNSEEIKALMSQYDASVKASMKPTFFETILGIFGFYLSGRVSSEQKAWTTLTGMYAEKGSLLNGSILGGNIFSEIFILARDLFIQDEVRSGSYKGQKKWEKDFKSKIPYVKSWVLFDDPFEAYKNWDYGRRVGK